MEEDLTEMIKKIVEKSMLEESLIEIEASGRHAHLSREAIDYLFGKDYQLNSLKELSQPGQYASEERITIQGPKGKIDNVIVLGPERNASQVEVSQTDAVVLGEKVPVRESGDIEGTPGITLIYKDRKLQLDKGLIVAKRHVHVSQVDAAQLNVKQNEIVQVKVFGDRSLIFDEVVIRVSPDFRTAMHIDFDEANACGFKKGMLGKIIKKEPNVKTVAKQQVQPAKKVNEPEKKTTTQAKLSKKVITESDLQRLFLQKIDHILIPEKSIITPLAEDYIRRNELNIERCQEDDL